MTATFECRDLGKSFGSTQALRNVNISIAPGRVVGLLGPNGSGKTTLIKLANGLLSPSHGEVLICGEEPGPESKALVSYLPDKTCMPMWMNVEQLMDFFQDFYADTGPQLITGNNKITHSLKWSADCPNPLFPEDGSHLDSIDPIHHAVDYIRAVCMACFNREPYAIADKQIAHILYPMYPMVIHNLGIALGWTEIVLLRRIKHDYRQAGGCQWLCRFQGRRVIKMKRDNRDGSLLFE